jgi:hypothetical protein
MTPVALSVVNFLFPLRYLILLNGNYLCASLDVREDNVWVCDLRMSRYIRIPSLRNLGKKKGEKGFAEKDTKFKRV